MSNIHSLHINGSNLFGGAERFLLRLVNALNEDGQKASIILRPKSPMLNEILKDTSVSRYPMVNKWDLLSTIQIKNHIHKTKPDVVQTYMGRATRLTRVPKSLNIPHIARLGGYYKIDGYYRHADAWVGNTKGLCDYLVQQRLPQNRVYHISNFVDTQKQAHSQAELKETQKRLGIPNDGIILFALGRLVNVKGFDVLIKALSILTEKMKDRPVHLILAGTGSSEKQLKQQASELKLNDKIHFIGWQQDSSQYFQMCDLFVCPSNQETLGNVILEAWSHKKAVLSTNTAGGKELIEPETSGLITPIGDSQAMAEHILEILKMSEGEKSEIGENGFKTLVKNHSKTAILNQYKELYKELI